MSTGQRDKTGKLTSKFQVGDVIRDNNAQHSEMFLITGVSKNNSDDRSRVIYSYTCKRLFRMFADTSDQLEFVISGSNMKKVTLVDIGNAYSRLVNVINENFRNKDDG